MHILISHPAPPSDLASLYSYPQTEQDTQRLLLGPASCTSFITLLLLIAYIMAGFNIQYSASSCKHEGRWLPGNIQDGAVAIIPCARAHCAVPASLPEQWLHPHSACMLEKPLKFKKPRERPAWSYHYNYPDGQSQATLRWQVCSGRSDGGGIGSALCYPVL